ncbi:hypothetical protein DYB31_010115 [Aphanomyces astaci]|uniref:Glutathionylspermidine synthase pre-ATP-grasp-like domain-containing protein n=1 Tax=Aphanomyces astaci TaxID=112090 RepID=A0A397FBJ6_APHAT|nr:hypothetical protein DYB31_010115 [Aphanomyces astaci]
MVTTTVTTSSTVLSSPKAKQAPSITTTVSLNHVFPNSYKDDLAVHSLQVPTDVGHARYLDQSLPYVPVFEEQYGPEVSSSLQTKYYTLTESGQAGIEAATATLHALFVQATEHVLANQESLAPYFHIPAALWPRIQDSWARQYVIKNDTISGRLDFALTDHGIKVYEYNADSASCLMECGYTQDAWSNAAGLGSIGRSNSSTLFTQLTAAWKSKNVQGTLHLLCDNDPEERYHSLYMKATAEAAGIPCVLVVGVQDLHFDSSDGTTILDGQNRPLRNVWKTWAWQTVISQYEARNAGAAATSGVVQVMDVMLHPSVRVFEPLWTVLPSSKAILPILTQLAPDNPYLLRSTFDAADIPLFTGGYVAKPVMGRTGANVSIYNGSGDLISATAGKWVDDTIVYQEIALLPKYEDDCYVQVNTWAIDGEYGGTVLRIDESNIIGLSSGIYPMPEEAVGTMHLMNITLQEGGAITDAVYGNFCGTKSQDIVCSGGTSIRLLQTQSPSEAGGGLKQLQTIHSQQVFGVIRSLLPFRLTGGTKDFLVVGTDSGKITVLEFMVELSRWEVRHSETYGKTGCRRITPGQHLASDPKGRAIMVGAVEKQKLVYIMNRDASNRLTISSPLEAHRSHAIHFDIVGVDVGFENPIFAILEVDYSEHDDGTLGVADAVKSLVYYELDLGLNHVTRRWSEPVLRSANKLIAVPGGTDGPGGVLVCSEGWIVYKNERHPEVPCRIPQRARPVNTNVDVRSEVLIVAAATHKQRDLFFVIVQSELGDLYKVTLTYVNDQVSAVKVKFFDTLPPAVALCITKTGYLFAASEASKHYLLQFQSIGDNDNTAEAHSFQEYVPSFTLRRLTNLALVESLDSLAPITQLLVDDLANEHTPQMYALCGQGNRSTLRVLRHGLSITEVACSPLPHIAKAVWCLKAQHDDAVHKYIVVSFEDNTLVLLVLVS